MKIPATRNSDGEYNVDSKPKDPEFEAAEKGDDFNANSDDFEGDDNYEDDGGEDGDDAKDPSYEPDFDK